MTTARRLSRAEILELPPVITLAQLARVLEMSEPTIRQANRSGELERMGIRVNKLGTQYRVVTASVWAYLGLTGGASSAPAVGNDAGQRGPVSHGVRFLAPCARPTETRAPGPRQARARQREGENRDIRQEALH